MVNKKRIRRNKTQTQNHGDVKVARFVSLIGSGVGGAAIGGSIGLVMSPAGVIPGLIIGSVVGAASVFVVDSK